jgi:hypothetical protein
MVISPLSLRTDYWDTFTVEEEDLDYLYNHLLEIETPLTTAELTSALVNERINREKKALENRAPAEGKMYLPKEHYQVGDSLVFPALGWQKGKVTRVRPGNNPEVPAFEVIEVQIEKGSKRSFAAALETHRLNQPIEIKIDDPNLIPEQVIARYGAELSQKLETRLNAKTDLVQIAARWFPRALLVDVSVGHLNLAEAVLDMAAGGPLPTKSLLEQVELPTDVNPKLTEFSMNHALQEDARFDEVGPSGEVLWFLQRLEPAEIHTPPITLRSSNASYNPDVLTAEMHALETELDDELSHIPANGEKPQSVRVSLIYPHWRAGTLPLSERIERLFPTAYEAPRIRFTLVDADSGKKYDGWVVRAHRFVYGLRPWYEEQAVFPGSMVQIQKGKKSGEVIVKVEKRRSARDWVRTVLVGADGGIVYAMLKQTVATTFDERMAIAIPDQGALDKVWEQGSKSRGPLQNVVKDTMRELAKLTPQGNVHAQELYAAVNVVRRSPPGPIFDQLVTNPTFVHVGDLYYRLSEETDQEKPA